MPIDWPLFAALVLYFRVEIPEEIGKMVDLKQQFTESSHLVVFTLIQKKPFIFIFPFKEQFRYKHEPNYTEI